MTKRKEKEKVELELSAEAQQLLKEAIAGISPLDSLGTEAWLQYGTALKECRDSLGENLSDRAFGKIIKKHGLDVFQDGSGQGIHPAARSAAIWAVEHPEQLKEAQEMEDPPSVSSRGGFRALHQKWKDKQKKQPANSPKVKEAAEQNTPHVKDARAVGEVAPSRTPWATADAYQRAVSAMKDAKEGLSAGSTKLLERLHEKREQGADAAALSTSGDAVAELLAAQLILEVAPGYYVAAVYPAHPKTE